MVDRRNAAANDDTTLVGRGRRPDNAIARRIIQTHTQCEPSFLESQRHPMTWRAISARPTHTRSLQPRFLSHNGIP